MSFQTQTATTFVKLRLTDLGKQKMSQGTFNLSQAVFSDREINYGFNKRYRDVLGFANLNPASNNLHDAADNFVLSPAHSAPDLPKRNYDGTLPFDISDNITISEQILTARTESRGLWSAMTDGSRQQIGRYMIDESKCKMSGVVDATELQGNQNIEVSTGSTGLTGDLVYIRCIHPIANVPNAVENNAIFSQMYRIREITSPSPPDYELLLDRNTIDFPALAEDSYIYYYPFSATTDYWNSGTTAPGEVWSFACVRTNSEIGTTIDMIQNGSGYTTYGSKEFNGTKRYFGFDADQRAVGFVWHQDNFTGETYGDLFIPNSTELDLPDVMWHRKIGIESGKAPASLGGHRFVDYNSKIHYDDKARSEYTLLYDGVDANKIAVGRVYFELKIIAITHHELLSAMTYKSNRNFTLPQLKVDLREIHADDVATPFVEEGKTYYFTYQVKVEDRNYDAPIPLPCAQWTKVNGVTKADGTKYFPTLSLPPDGFPYLRTTTPNKNTKLSSSGTGYSLGKFQILMNVLDNDEEGATVTADRARPNQWSAATNGMGTTNTNGYLYDVTGGLLPHVLSTKVFNLRKEDFGEYIGYDFEANNNRYVLASSMTSWMETEADTGLSFGNETFLNGNVKTTFGLRTQKIIVTINLDKEKLNDSVQKSVASDSFNGSFNLTEKKSSDGGFNGSFNLTEKKIGKIDQFPDETYITEIGLFSDDGKLMAVGKPTKPVKKTDGRHLIFQLEINI